MIIRTPDGPGGGAPDDGQQKSVMPLATAIFQCERHGWGPKRGGAGALPRPHGAYFHRYSVHTGENDVHCMVPREVTAPEMPDDGELPLTKAGEPGQCSWGRARLSPMALQDWLGK